MKKIHTFALSLTVTVLLLFGSFVLTSWLFLENFEGGTGGYLSWYQGKYDLEKNEYDDKKTCLYWYRQVDENSWSGKRLYCINIQLHKKL